MGHSIAGGCAQVEKSKRARASRCPFPLSNLRILFIAYANLLDQVKFMMKKALLFSSGGDKNILASPPPLSPTHLNSDL